MEEPEHPRDLPPEPGVPPGVEPRTPGEQPGEAPRRRQTDWLQREEPEPPEEAHHSPRKDWRGPRRPSRQPCRLRGQPEEVLLPALVLQRG